MSAAAETTGEPMAQASERMRLWVGRARAAGALVGFVLGFLMCRRAGIPAVDATLRALLAAAALSLVAWWSTLLVLQALVRSAAVQYRAEVEAAMAQMAAAESDRRAEEAEEVDRRLRRHRGEPEPVVPDASGDAGEEGA